jgi:hypothetical protein
LENNEDLQKLVRSTIGTKFSSKWGDLLVDLAVQAVRTVWSKDEQGNIEFRNPYRLEYETYLDSLPLVAVRGLSDPAFQARFMAKALKVEAKYRSYNEDNFSGRPKLSSSKSFLTKKIGEANNLCKIARNIK